MLRGTGIVLVQIAIGVPITLRRRASAVVRRAEVEQKLVLENE